MHPLLKLWQKDMTRWNNAEWELYDYLMAYIV